MRLLNKENLAILNKRSHRYHLATAEKDYFLAVISKIIFDSPLRDKLVFKGGTAIHHCYLPQYRFSEDLDFTSIDRNITPEEVKAVLEKYDFIRIKKEYLSKSTIKFERVQYTGPLSLPNYLKIEIDFVQNVVLPARRMEYKNTWGVDTDVMVMDVNEICAEKTRACSDRAKYRDFYDLFLLFQETRPAWKKVLELVKRKEIRKTISKNSILLNWETARKEKLSEMAQVHYEKAVDDELIQSFIESIPLTQILRQSVSH